MDILKKIVIVTIVVGVILVTVAVLLDSRPKDTEQPGFVVEEPGFSYSYIYDGFPDEMKSCVEDRISTEAMKEWRYSNTSPTDEEWMTIKDCSEKFY